MDKLTDAYENLQFFKDFAEGRRESEVVFISVENLNWLINAVDITRRQNRPNHSLVERLKVKNKIIEELNKHNEALIIENLQFKSKSI